MQVNDKPWAICRYGKVVERYGQRNEAIQEAMWAVVGEGYNFNDRDEESVYLDLREGYEVVGWSVARVVE